MPITNPDQLLHLAPDAKTLEAGRRLFYSRRWRAVGGDGQWLWGEFVYGDGPRSKASETAVELTTGRYFCNCRARQRPCAHGLALVLMLKNDQARITVGQPPSWVRNVQFRAEDRPRAVTDPRAADERLDARLETMTRGVEELELRLLDFARRGIADTLAQGPEPLLAAAARLTDAKLRGVAGHLRRIAALGVEGTEASVARTLGDLYLFVRAWKNKEELSVARHDELTQYAGLTLRQDEVLRYPGHDDHWLVMGTTEGQEDKLRFRRTWLRAEGSRRFALLQDYAFGTAAYERAWPLGASFTGKVHYYPGSYAQRAVFPRPRVGGRPYDGLAGYADFAGLRTNYRRALAAQPWLYAYPVYLQGVRPARERSTAYLIDPAGEALPLVADYGGYYALLAVSGGRGLDVFAEFDGYRLRPLSLVVGGALAPA